MDAIPALFFCSIALIAVMSAYTQVPRVYAVLSVFVVIARASAEPVRRRAKRASAYVSKLRSIYEQSVWDIEEKPAARPADAEIGVRPPAPPEAPSPPEVPSKRRDVLIVYENTAAVERNPPRVTRLAPTPPATTVSERAAPEPPRPIPEPPRPARRDEPARPTPPPDISPPNIPVPRREVFASAPPPKPEPVAPPERVAAEAPPSAPPRPARQPEPPTRIAPSETHTPLTLAERIAPPSRPIEKMPPTEMETESGRDVFARLADATRFNDDDTTKPAEEIPVDDRIPSSLIVFMHVTGGAGATTLAVNTACSLAGPRRNCCLLDLDVQFGGVASLMDLPPQPAMQALMQDPRRLERVAFESMLVRHSSGVHVLTAPRVPIPLHGLKASAISELVRMAIERFTFVVVDMPLALTTWTDAVLRPAKFVYLVTPLTVQAAHRTARVLHLLKQQELANLPIKIIANRYNSAGDSAIGPKQFAKAIGRNVDHLLPNDYELVLQSHNQGVPAVKLAPKAKFSLAVTKMLADDLNEAPVGQPQRKFAGFDR